MGEVGRVTGGPCPPLRLPPASLGVVFHPADGSGRLAHQLRADYFDMQKAGGMDQMFDGECAAWPVDFYPVAEVDTGDLQEAFTLTNSIDRPWWENRRVKCLRRDRSTSVWDLLETRAGLYRVASSGFEPFPVAGRVGAP